MRRLDVHELVMLGVVGIGAYAVYRLVRSSPSPELRTVPRPADLPPPVELPVRAGTTPVAPPGTNVVAKPNELHPQFWYAGRAELFGTNLQDLPASRLADVLSISGFGGSKIRPDAPEAASLPRTVQVYTTPADALAAGFPAWAVADPGVGTRWFYGRWTGEAPTTGVPDLIKLMWRAAPPKATLA